MRTRHLNFWIIKSRNTGIEGHGVGMKRKQGQEISRKLDRFILDGIASANLKRVFFMSLVAIPVNITHIVIFGMDRPADAIESMWRSGIIART